MQWKRGLWRLGWVLWATTVVPTIFIARQKSVEPDCLWIESDWFQRNAPPTLSEDFFDKKNQFERENLKTDVPGVGTAYIPNYFRPEQIEKAVSSLQKWVAANEIKLPTPPPGYVLEQPVAYTCTVQWKSNRLKVVLYSTLGLSLGFVLIQGGFRMILWMIAGFRNG